MRLIIIQGGEGDMAGASIRCVFRFPVPADFQARFAKKDAVSLAEDATPEEIEALTAGQYAEISEVNSFPEANDLGKLQAALVDIHAKRQEEFIAREKKRRTFVGMSWDGKDWSTK